ncbi:MAG: hypothetical protein ABI763_13690 [Bacteroidota bacterium]
MIYKAYNLDTQKLLSLPETGMGCQVIDAFKPGRNIKERFIVYNAELAVDYDSRFVEYSNLILAKGFGRTLNEAEAFPVATESISLVPKMLIVQARGITESKKSNKHRYSGGRGAKESPEEKANGSDVFVRLSPYPDDHRIDTSNNRLIDGSYTTPQQDYKDCVIYKDDPIDRYALPYKDGETVNWAYYLKPLQGDIVQRGIVQPAFNHDGGGIEAYFKNGTSKNTYLYKRPYGQ